MDERNIFEEDIWQGDNGQTPFESVNVDDAKKTFSRFNLALFAYILIANIVAIAISVIVAFVLPPDISASVSGSVWYQWLVGVGPAYFIGLPTLFLIVKNMELTTRVPKKLGIKPAPDKFGIDEFLGLFLVAEAFMFVGNLIGTTLNTTIGAIFGYEIENALDTLITDTPVWVLFLIVVVIGPIIEEFIFRKLMIDRFAKFGDVLAIIFSAVAFGLFHGNFYQFFYAAFLGLILGYIYTRTGNIVYPIVMHALLNFFGSIVTLPVIKFEEYLMPVLNGEVSMETLDLRLLMTSMIGLYSYVIVQYAMVIGGAIIFFFALRDRKIQLNKYPPKPIPKHRVAESALLNAGTILFLLLSLVTFVISVLPISAA